MNILIDEKEAIFIKKKIDSARETSKPESIKLLFIAEAPPEEIKRFFYYEEVKDNDWLYLAIVKALCENESYNIAKIRANKKKILQKLQQDGIYLMDLCPIPLKWGIIAELHKDDFMQRLENEKAIDKSITNIILIKTNVYDCLYRELKDKQYMVQDKRIPFPSSGQQKRFADMMKKALKAIEYIPNEGVKEIKELVY